MSSPRPFGVDWQFWGNRLSQYIDATRDKLTWRRGETKAPEDGILLWDNTDKNPVVSTDGVYRTVLANPVHHIEFVLDPQYDPAPGEMAWNTFESTLNIGHINGVTQQVGFEQYIRAYNGSGSTLVDGDIVSFSGVLSADPTINYFIADGSIRPLYFLGVVTGVANNGEFTFVTTFGKVRDLDTTGASVGETWAVGDVLYASPTNLGKLTKFRPSAPNEVISVAAVLVAHPTAGVIFVRPTVSIGLDYGTFSAATTQTLAATNTGYPIRYGVTNTSHNISVVNDGSGNPTRVTVNQSGYYVISFTNQYTSSNASSTRVHTWLRKNGVDIPATNTQYSLKANGDTTVVSATFSLSLLAGDYLQIMWGADSTQVSLDSIAASGWSPSAPGSFLTVDQTQL